MRCDLGPSWGRLGPFWGSLGGPFGAFLDHLELFWGELKQFKIEKRDARKTYKNIRKINVFGFPEAAKWGQVGPMLGSSCDLDPSESHLGGNLAEDGQEDEVKLT